MRVDNSTGKGPSSKTSGMDKFSSEVHRVHMELGGKLLNSLRIKTQFFERLQREIVVDGAAHTQKDDVESNGVSLECCKGLCASPPLFCVFGVSFHPPGFLLRLLSCAPSTLYSTWVLFFFMVSFPWFWVSLSSFLLLSPLLEPSLLYFFCCLSGPCWGP